MKVPWNILPNLKILRDINVTVQEEPVSQASIHHAYQRLTSSRKSCCSLRVIPVGDSRVKVEWYRNDVSIQTCKLYFREI